MKITVLLFIFCLSLFSSCTKKDTLPIAQEEETTLYIEQENAPVPYKQSRPQITFVPSKEAI